MFCDPLAAGRPGSLPHCSVSTEIDHTGTGLSGERGGCRFTEAFASDWVLFYRLKKKKSNLKQVKGERCLLFLLQSPGPTPTPLVGCLGGGGAVERIQTTQPCSVF